MRAPVISGRALTNVVRACDLTTLLYKLGNKIYFNHVKPEKFSMKLHTIKSG